MVRLGRGPTGVARSGQAGAPSREAAALPSMTRGIRGLRRWWARWRPWIWSPARSVVSLVYGRPAARCGAGEGCWFPAGVPVAAHIFMAMLRAVPASYEIGVTRLLVKIAPTAVMAGDGGVFDVVSFSRHCRCRLRQNDRDVLGETLDLCLPDRTMTAPHSVSFSLMRASFWSRSWLEGTRGGAVFHLSQGRRRDLAV